MKELEVEIRIRSNLLKERRTKLGLTIPELSCLLGVSVASYSELELLKVSPVTKRGVWRVAAVALADFYHVSLKELFPDAVMDIKKNVIRSKLNKDEIVPMLTGHQERLLSSPDQVFDKLELRSQIEKVLDTLSPKEAFILRSYFIAGKTEREIGESLGVGAGRVNQVGARALRKIRHPSRSKYLKPFVSDESLFCSLDDQVSDLTIMNDAAVETYKRPMTKEDGEPRGRIFKCWYCGEDEQDDHLIWNSNKEVFLCVSCDVASSSLAHPGAGGLWEEPDNRQRWGLGSGIEESHKKKSVKKKSRKENKMNKPTIPRKEGLPKIIIPMLRKIRNETGMSLDEVTFHTGISTRQLSIIERGLSRKVADKHKKALVALFDCPVEDLFAEDKEAQDG